MDISMSLTIGKRINLFLFLISKVYVLFIRCLMFRIVQNIVFNQFILLFYRRVENVRLVFRIFWYSHGLLLFGFRVFFTLDIFVYTY